jgi:N-acylneuraminate cytidylyltransferase
MKLAVIPARGGSKRIPLKNIKPFCGKPMIAYSIENAVHSGLFDKVLVSTDNTEIADISRSYGAEVPFLRPQYLADDYTGTNDVVKHAIEWYQDQGQEIEVVCCIYATAPFVQIEYLKQGYDLLKSTNHAYAFSVTSFPFPIQRALKVNVSGEVQAFWPENNDVRSQDLEEAYHDAGQFYWGQVDAFLQDKVIYSKESMAVMLPRHLVQDIDTEEDWLRAELMYQVLELNDKSKV